MLPNTVKIMEIEEGTDADGSKLVKREIVLSPVDEEVRMGGMKG